MTPGGDGPALLRASQSLDPALFVSREQVGDAAALLTDQRAEFSLVVRPADGLAGAADHPEPALGHRPDAPVAHPGEGREIVDAVAVLETPCRRAVQAGRAVVPTGAVGDGVEPQVGDPLDGVLVHPLDSVTRVAVRPDLPGGVGEDGAIQGHAAESRVERRRFSFTAVCRGGITVADTVGVFAVGRVGVAGSVADVVNGRTESSGGAAGVGPVVGDAGVTGDQRHLIEGCEDERGQGGVAATAEQDGRVHGRSATADVEAVVVGFQFAQEFFHVVLVDAALDAAALGQGDHLLLDLLAELGL